jgi:hypothetical protein
MRLTCFQKIARMSGMNGPQKKEATARMSQPQPQTALSSRAVLTPAPVQAGDFSGTAQEFGRTEHVFRQFGIKRGTLYNLHGEGKVRGCVLRVKGRQKGVRLWDMQSIRDYIRSQFDAIPPKDDGDTAMTA